MALTIGAAPLTHPPGGTYNFDFDQLAPDHILYLEDVPKRIRGVLANETILDTRRGKMLHETGEFIQWYIPLEDVRSEVLKPSNRRTSNPYKGDTTFYNVRVGEHVETNAAWSHERAPQASPPLRDLVAFDFARLDAWFEEDDQIFGHSRDPYHRFDCRHTSEHVEVHVGGKAIADTRRAIKRFETSMPSRYYIPVEHVKPDALTPSDTRTLCPYKGEAAYYNVQGGARTLTDGAWPCRRHMAKPSSRSVMSAFGATNSQSTPTESAFDRTTPTLD